MSVLPWGNSLPYETPWYSQPSCWTPTNFLLLVRAHLRKRSNLFFLLSVGAFRFVRAKIIECILSTDMKQHFEAISKFRVRRLNEEFSMRTSVEDRWATLRMCIKMGDLSHTAIPWSEHFHMSCAIAEEFYQQGDEVRVETLHRVPPDKSAASGKGHLGSLYKPIARQRRCP